MLQTIWRSILEVRSEYYDYRNSVHTRRLVGYFVVGRGEVRSDNLAHVCSLTVDTGNGGGVSALISASTSVVASSISLSTLISFGNRAFLGAGGGVYAAIGADGTIADCIVSLSNLIAVNNSASEGESAVRTTVVHSGGQLELTCRDFIRTTEGGGAFASIAGLSMRNCTLIVDQATLLDNTASSGGGVYLVLDANSGQVSSSGSTLTRVTAHGNVVFEGSGAGVSITLPADAQPRHQCVNPASFYPYVHNTFATLDSCSLANNRGTCGTCSGGGLSVGVGGVVTIRNTEVMNNSATLFGGGMLLGSVQLSATCAFVISRSRLDGNRAGHGGSQMPRYQTRCST
jgi:hypothetical protein